MAPVEIRDPIHGAIELSAAEAQLVRQPFVQRLRHIKQLGFSHVPFPGACHTRYAHCLGVMHLAGLAFDRAYRDWTFAEPDARTRLRAAVRLAALCHDLGHAPFSHCTEFAMPRRSTLNIGWYGEDPSKDAGAASHEDFTIAILEQTALAAAIAQGFPCEAVHVAALISPEVHPGDAFFRDGGLDHRRLLSQIISSELDADRLDYLVRDAYFSGAQYGQVDVRWILSNLTAHPADGRVCLALQSAGLYAFEDFLVSRHHMFLMVYFHHKAVVYEEMLKRWVGSEDVSWRISPDLDAYLHCDDIALESELRRSSNRWARGLVQRKEYRRIVERHGPTPQVSVAREAEALRAAGFEVIVSESNGKLSRYALGRRRRGAPTIYVKERLPGQRVTRVRSLLDASSVFERYAESHCIARIYVAPDDRPAAQEVLGLA